MNELTKLIKSDMKPALGVTEPGAIAFAVARAKQELSGSIKKVEVRLNSGMYKNAYTCGIPNSDEVGNVFAAALGVVAGDASLGLESLSKVKPADNVKAKEMVDAGRITAVLDHMGSDIEIMADVTTTEGNCVVHIRGSHTNIISIVKDGTFIFGEETLEDFREKDKEIGNSKDKKSIKGEQQIPLIHKYTMKQIYEYVISVPIDEIMFIKEAYEVNLKLFQAGMESKKTTFIHQLYKANGDRIFSSNSKETAQLLCAGAIEARVLGLSNPAMSITGSGAHGIIATLPLYAYRWIQLHQKEQDTGVIESGQEECTEESLLRATALSYLITMYIKEYSGKLSAFCGCGIAAGTGMACGLAYLQGGGVEQLTRVIWNMSAGITGMICDGGNQGCTMKGIVATDAAFRAVDMAMMDVYVKPEHGINGYTPEQTMRHMGMIASPGMVETEKTIVEIMKEK